MFDKERKRFSFQLLDKRAIQDLIKEIDPMMQIDEEVEDVSGLFLRDVIH